MKFTGVYIILVLGQVASLTQGKKPHHIKRKHLVRKNITVVRKNLNIEGHPITYHQVLSSFYDSSIP